MLEIHSSGNCHQSKTIEYLVPFSLKLLDKIGIAAKFFHDATQWKKVITELTFMQNECW